MNVDKIKAALADDHHSRNAYTGRIKQRVETHTFAEDGTPIHLEVDVMISWDTFKQMLGLVRERAGL